jgi:hypothetical protein
MATPTIQLQAGQFSVVPRQIAGKNINLFIINGQPYIANQDSAAVMEVTEKTVRDQLDNVYAEESSNSGGGIESPPQIFQPHSVPVTYQKDSTGWGGGGTQYITVNPLGVFLKGARRMRNAERQAAILNEVDAIYLEYQTTGIVVNQYAAQHDPSVMNNLYQLFAMPKWPSWRDNMRVINNALIAAISRCPDTWNLDGTQNRALVNVTARLVHSNLYLAQFGMTATDLFIERADPMLLNLNHITHMNPAFPAEWEFRNVTNLQHEDELGLRASKTQELIHFTDGLRRVGVNVTTDLFLRCSVRLTRGTSYNPYVLVDGQVTDDPMMHRRTIVYRNPTGRTRKQSCIEAERIVEEYERNFFARKTWTVEEMAIRQHYYDVLQQELIENMDEMGELVMNNNAANYPVEGTVSQPVPGSRGFDL